MRELENSMVRDGYDPWEPTADERASYEEYMASRPRYTVLDSLRDSGFLDTLFKEADNGNTEEVRGQSEGNA